MSEEAQTSSTSATTSNEASQDTSGSLTSQTLTEGMVKPRLPKSLTKSKATVTKSAMTKAENDLAATSKKGKQIGTPSPEAQAQTEPNAEAKPPEPVKPPEPKKYKVKINGEDREVSEEVLLRDYQLREASNEKFRKAAELEKRNQALLMKIKDPQGLVEFLQAFGLDPDRLAEERIASRLEYEMMTPEQKQFMEIKQRNAVLEQQAKLIAEEKQRAAQNELDQRHASKLNTEVIATLESNDLPKTADMVRRMVRQMRTLVEQGVDAGPAQVVDLVKEEIAKENRMILSQMTPKQLVEYVGKDKLDEFRKWELSQIKNPIAAAPAPEENAQQVRPSQQRKHFKTMKDFERRMAAIKGIR